MASNSRLPIDRGWAWVIVVASFMNIFFMVGLAKSFGILVEQFIKTFDISTALATMVMSVAGIVYALLAPISIILGQQFTSRAVIMVGGFLAFIGISTSSLLLSMGYVIGFLGVGFGIGNSTIYGNSMIMIGNYFRERRTLANGLALAGASIGQFTLPPLIQLLLDTYGLNGTLLLLGALYFHVTLFATLLRPIKSYMSVDSTVRNPKIEMVTKDDIEITTFQVSDNLLPESQDQVNQEMKLRISMASTGSIHLLEDVEADVVDDVNIQKNGYVGKENAVSKGNICRAMFDFSVLRRPVPIFYVICSFLAFFGYFNFILFLPLHVTSKGVTRYDKALVISICGIGDLIGRISSGILGDLNLIQRYKIKAAAVICVGLTMLCFVVADSFAFMATLSGIYGFFGGVYVNYTSIVLIDFVGLKMMPKVLAFILLIQGVGAAAGQPFLGWLRDTTGSYDMIIYICGILPVVGGCLLLFYPFVKKRDNYIDT